MKWWPTPEKDPESLSPQQIREQWTPADRQECADFKSLLIDIVQSSSVAEHVKIKIFSEIEEADPAVSDDAFICTSHRDTLDRPARTLALAMRLHLIRPLLLGENRAQSLMYPGLNTMAYADWTPEEKLFARLQALQEPFAAQLTGFRPLEKRRNRQHIQDPRKAYEGIA